MAKLTAERGYSNLDRDIHPFRINSDDRIGLELHVLDFENYDTSSEAVHNQFELANYLSTEQYDKGSGFLYPDEVTLLTTAKQKAVNIFQRYLHKVRFRLLMTSPGISLLFFTHCREHD